MKILQIVCKAIRGVPDGTYAFTNPRTGAPLDVVLITGGPGAGKTGLLEAVAAAKEAIGSYGPPPYRPGLLRHGAERGHIETTWLLSDADRVRAGLEGTQHVVAWDLGKAPSPAQADTRLRRFFATYSRDPDHGKLEYFPAGRRLLTRAQRPTGTPVSPSAEARVRLARDPDKYGDLPGVLHDLALREAGRLTERIASRGIAVRNDQGDALAPFRTAISAMLPDLRLAEVALDAPQTVTFLRRDHTPVELADLSDAEQQGVLFALAFKHFGLNRSIVLLDEPELHVHAAHRAHFLHALVGLGRDNQILAATGAAELLAAAAPGQVLDLSARARTTVTAC